MKLTTTLLLVMFDMALARPSPHQTTGKHYDCKSFDIPITVADIPTLALPFLPVADQYQATNVLNTLTARTQSGAAPKVVNVSGIYNIATQYCFPLDQPLSSTLQILTHGIGFNASYWDFYLLSNQGDTQYSYISTVTAAGYSTLSYNRLGISGSTLANPDTEVQSPVELSILVQLTQLAREGKLFDQQPKPSKIIHVGHSYGSHLTNALVAKEPSLSDGVILTGYSYQGSYGSSFLINSNLLLASVANSTRFPPSQYPNGYVTWPSQWSNQYAFFAYPQFDPAVLAQAEATKEPFTIAEFLSFSILSLDAPGFKGPVFYVNAEKDQIGCGFNCTGLVGPGTDAYNAFNGTSDIESVIIAGAGHGLNLHYSARETYGKINDWVKRHGF
ncbi:hypothetical protein H2198_007774 [Neophaeococcomyces mojaviensis]|uniref:Uncharacterized protein n=1 Tax=Neophaeococcomyces mojaviensis TaxID=3383035 RepID=A0ACC2ZYZ4_9EURO|nr:hypothetical protein H2198_007774 [Knufia sp. JES_112]